MSIVRASESDRSGILDLQWGLPESEGIVADRFESSRSLSDFEVVFLDPGPIEGLWSSHISPGPDGSFSTQVNRDHGLGRGILNLMKTRREEIQLLLDTGGMVFCRLRPPDRPITIREPETEHIIHSYSWIPQGQNKGILEDLSLKKRSGTKVELYDTDTPLTSFFRRYLDNFIYYCVLEDSASDSEWNLRPLLTNHLSEIVAFQVDLLEGSIFFLPFAEGGHEEMEMALLECSEDLLLQKSEPHWVDEYRWGREEELRRQLDKVEDRIFRLKEKQGELEEQRRDLRQYYRLLYEGNRVRLSALLRELFQETGLDIKDTDTKADFAIRSEDHLILVSVGANHTGPVGFQPFERLLNSLNHVNGNSNELVRGLVIFNGYASQEPTQRGEDPLERIEGVSGDYDISLLSSIDLHSMFKKAHLMGKSLNLEDLFSSSG